MRKTGSMIVFPSFFVTALSLIMFVLGLNGCGPHSDEGSKLREASLPAEEETFSKEQEEDTGSVQSIFVYVCGEVYSPGVYELPADSRVFEAVNAAGGMKETAAVSYLNQAEKVSDGQKLYVPSQEEAAGQDVDARGMEETDDGRVNLNTASKEELMTLSGIGEVKAEAILRYREEKGGFTSIEELKEIEGIKEGVFNKVKDQVKT